MNPPPEDPIVVYCLPGSQSSFTVLVTLQARRVPHYVHFVPADPEARRRVLPSGGTRVPEIRVGTGASAVVVQGGEDDNNGSEAILEWLDEHRRLQLYPSDTPARILSFRASCRTLAGMVWYYNWVDDDGSARSMLKSGREMLPRSVSKYVPDAVVTALFAGTRAKYKKLAAEALGVPEKELQPSNQPRLRSLLVAELEFFQSHLQDAAQPFLIPHTRMPTAADFSVYAQLDRLIGGDSSDVIVYPSLPELRYEAHGLDRLWQWYDRMRHHYPVRFKGRRPPKELLRVE